MQLMANLNDNVLTLHGLPDVRADWSVLGLVGHSTGADVILRVVESNKTIAKVYYMQYNQFLST